MHSVHNDSEYRDSARAGVKALLEPRSVAIVGATPRPESLGGRPVLNLLAQGYTGRIFPVNPRYQEIQGLPCYPSLRSLPQVPDLVLVLVGKARVFDVLDEALKVGARTALIFGGGFAEVSGEGTARQARLASYAQRGLRICGPNCNGVMNLVDGIALGFMPTFELPVRAGNIAVVSQSGNIATCLSSRGLEAGLGFSYLIASGNEADLEMADYVEYLLDDPATQVLALFVEGFRNPQRFLAVAEQALRKGKPIVLMKMGRTASSERVALSHTGSMTGSYRVITGALRQKGVIVVEDLDTLIAVASVMASGKRPRGGAVAVASLSGGMAGVVADVCDELGEPLAALTPTTIAAVARNLPDVASIQNPLDMTGQVVNEPECWTRSIAALVADPGVDVLLGVLSITANRSERRFAQDLADLHAGTPALVITVWASGSPPGAGVEILVQAGTVVQLRVQDAVRAISHWRRYWTTRQARIAALDALHAQPAPRSTGKAMTDWALLEEAGIPVARKVLVHDARQLEDALGTLAFPVALKLESAAVAHKTELGALRLNVRSLQEARGAFDDLQRIAARHAAAGEDSGVLVQAMVTGRRELLLGLKREPSVGTAVVVGMGGIFSELLQDIATRVAPLTALDAREMLSELSGHALLGAARGLGAVADGLLVDLLLNLSDLAIMQGERIRELDINPVIIGDDGRSAVAVDVLATYC